MGTGTVLGVAGGGQGRGVTCTERALGFPGALKAAQVWWLCPGLGNSVVERAGQSKGSQRHPIAIIAIIATKAPITSLTSPLPLTPLLTPLQPQVLLTILNIAGMFPPQDLCTDCFCNLDFIYLFFWNYIFLTPVQLLPHLLQAFTQMSPLQVVT